MTDNGVSSEPLTLTINGVDITAPMDEWNRVKRAVIKRQVDDQNAWEDAQRAAGQVWSVDYCSCGDGRGDWTDEYFTLTDLEDAIRRSVDYDASVLAVRDAAGHPFDVREWLL